MPCPPAADNASQQYYRKVQESISVIALLHCCNATAAVYYGKMILRVQHRTYIIRKVHSSIQILHSSYSHDLRHNRVWMVLLVDMLLCLFLHVFLLSVTYSSSRSS